MAFTSDNTSDDAAKPGELITFTPLNAQGVADSSKAIKAQYNPSSISYTESANYSESTIPHGSQQSKGNTLWNSSNAPRWSFTIFLDNFSVDGALMQTMAIMSPGSANTPVIANKAQALKDLFLKVSSDTHEPNDIEVTFGSIIFRGNCVSLNTQYKDFDPAGNPTSAEIALEFMELVPAELLGASNDLQSPDVTHSVSFEEGDYLTQVSAKMYGKPSFFREIAKANNLDSIRGIAPGTVLYLPPLEK